MYQRRVGSALRNARGGCDEMRLMNGRKTHGVGGGEGCMYQREGLN